ncbi:hypothetical protein CC78DRAFT_571208 [Lojkania enalia]|uniref:RING-type domain-containing protein n=1 Tax=Lojkania enalia TaxID=147567 RepID=A0A9P4N6A8_9PLEO|nr:hypothetical protein CC78DRAFT_571208 [Didymosphaeria enalia]
MSPPRHASRTSPSSFILFTTPLTVASLDPSSRECPICSEPYGEYQPNTANIISNYEVQEWAVRVDLCATPAGGARLCSHVFGRRCLEHHLRSNGAWHNKCPICRAPWFEPVDHCNTLTDPGPWISPEIAQGSTSETSDSNWTSENEMLVHDGNQSISETRDLGSGMTMSSRGRLHRSAGFLRQVLEAFNVEEGSDEVRGSVEEVERSLERLYANLEGRSELHASSTIWQ